MAIYIYILNMYNGTNIKFIKDDILMCPLTLQPITIKKFKDENNPIQLCHEESVADRKIYYDSEKKKLEFASRPNNLFLGYKLGNMQQQNMTIYDYLWNILKI